jgi:2-keto-4-pentenoate hydratase
MTKYNPIYLFCAVILTQTFIIPTLAQPKETLPPTVKEEITPIPPAINPEAIAQKLADNYFNKTPITQNLPPLKIKEAQQIQEQFIRKISTKHGKIIGYKAGLTNSNVQKIFNINEPIRGTLLEKMLLPSGAIVNAKFGAIPMVEADLIVRVKSEKINTAKTLQEILNNLDAIVPFLELPDLGYQPQLKLSATELIAINAGARLGIIGKPIELQPSKQWLKKINNIKVIIFDKDNKQIATGNSQELLGNPLKVVLWIKNSLKSEGKTLKKGDLLSLGSMTTMIPVTTGQTIRLQYQVLESKPVEIQVNFGNLPEF